jgi:5'-phosphate synthase pdxT subunit
VREHARVLEGLGARVTLVRRPEELAEIDGLVLPGGESTVIDKLARGFGLAEPVRTAIAGGMPVYGTCAGLILLADAVLDGTADQRTFGGLDIVVRRNAFGRQTESFETTLDIDGFDAPVDATFIRAPLIERVGPRARAIGSLPDGGVVAVEQGVLLGTSFHPEVTGEDRFHRRFLAHVRSR